MLDVLGKAEGWHWRICLGLPSEHLAKCYRGLTQIQCKNVIIISGKNTHPRQRTNRQYNVQKKEAKTKTRYIHTEYVLLAYPSNIFYRENNSDSLNHLGAYKGNITIVWHYVWILYHNLYHYKNSLCHVPPKVLLLITTEAISGAVWHWWCWQQSPSHITAASKVRPNERDV